MTHERPIDRGANQESLSVHSDGPVQDDTVWVPKVSSDLLARDDAYRDVSFPTAGRVYVSAMTSIIRISGVPASRSAATRPSAAGIWPSRWACRASSVSNVSKMP